MRYVVQLKQIESATEEEKQTELYDWARLLAAKDWGEVEGTIFVFKRRDGC